MQVVFLLIFVADTKVISGYKFVAPSFKDGLWEIRTKIAILTNFQYPDKGGSIINLFNQCKKNLCCAD